MRCLWIHLRHDLGFDHEERAVFSIVLKVNFEEKPQQQKKSHCCGKTWRRKHVGGQKDGLKKGRLAGPMTRRQTAKAKFTGAVGTDQIQPPESKIKRRQVDRKDEDGYEACLVKRDRKTSWQTSEKETQKREDDLGSEEQHEDRQGCHGRRRRYPQRLEAYLR